MRQDNNKNKSEKKQTYESEPVDNNQTEVQVIKKGTVTDQTIPWETSIRSRHNNQQKQNENLKGKLNMKGNKTTLRSKQVYERWKREYRLSYVQYQYENYQS